MTPSACQPIVRAHSRPVSHLSIALLALLCLPSLAQPVAAATQQAARGKVVFETICVNCHSLDANRAGPALRNVVGRPAGKAPDYFYSEALESATHVWDRAKLKAWLTDPEKVVPGQEMKFHLDKERDRDDVVAYLASLSRRSASAVVSHPVSQPTQGK